MTVPACQQAAAAWLAGLAGASPVETHISAVFVGRDTVWKLKKAVRLPFVDFSDIEKRHGFLLREIQLNDRGAPGLYRDVVAVLRRDGHLLLGQPQDCDEVVDWVLRMARVPAADFLDQMAADGAVTPAILDMIADAVAGFHAGLDAVACDQSAALAEVVRGNVASALQAGLPAADVHDWQHRVTVALEARRPWLAARARDGFVRRAHGDLHLGNLCLWHGAPVLFDALEFDEAMATIDLGYDLAFLLMDLDLKIDRAAANRVLNRYVARTGDAGLVAGLPPFQSLRALVRAHVQASRGQDPAAYLAAAGAYLCPAPALLIAVGGLPGTGKSTLARALAPETGAAPGALILRADEWRKQLRGVPPEGRLPPEAYTPDAGARVYASLAHHAQQAIVAGHSVIVDATFVDPAQRSALAQAARQAAVPFLGLWLQAPLAELTARVAARRHDASDATVDVLHDMAARDPGPVDWLPVPASDAGGALDRARQALRKLRKA
jgi:aminoglycoside phosphotransferase family enzyme/predicted kinase